MNEQIKAPAKYLNQITYGAIIATINLDGTKNTFSIDGVQPLPPKEFVREVTGQKEVCMHEADDIIANLIGIICDYDRDIRSGLGNGTTLHKMHAAGMMVSALSDSPFWKAEAKAIGDGNHSVSFEVLTRDEWEVVEGVQKRMADIRVAMKGGA